MPKGRPGRTPATCHPEKPVKGDGLCHTCYERRRVGYAPRQPAQQATCHPDRPQCAHGLCRSCYYKTSGYFQAYNAMPANKRRRLIARFAKLGVIAFDYDAEVAKQKGRCAVCGGVNRGRDLCIDHDHETKEFRGLLCANCNAGLGNFHDDVELLRKALRYLEGHARPRLRIVDVGSTPSG